MTISSIVDIVGGTLQNQPSISFITQIQTAPSKVNDGDLFLSNDIDDIKLAISNGAFGIVFDKTIQICDEEIAWIKVYDINLSLLKLARFILSTKNIRSLYCDDVSYELLKLFISNDKQNIFLTNDIKKDFEKIKFADNSIIYSKNQHYINTIDPSYSNFDLQKHNISNEIQHSLFKSTFSYNGKYFYKMHLPYIYIDNFLSVYNFLKIELDINKLKNLNIFSPIFINKDFEIVDFGLSNKFIIANDNPMLEEKEISYLQDKYHYAKIKILDYNTTIDLLSTITMLDFNALYIKGIKKQKVINILTNKAEISLSLL